MKRKLFISTTLGLLTISLIVFACSKKNSADMATNNNNNNSTGNTVSISGFAFVAATTSVATGTTVTWTNNDSAPHTVTADDNSFSSVTLNKGDTYSRTFTAAGTFPYHCSIHPTMTASVVVR